MKYSVYVLYKNGREVNEGTYDEADKINAERAALGLAETYEFETIGPRATVADVWITAHE